MASIAIREIYLETLHSLGDVNEEVEAAIRRHTVERISDKIASLRTEDRQWEEKYGCSYEVFREKTSSDPDFVERLHREQPTWELDAAHWEFCHKGVQDWTQELQRILTS